MLIVGITGGIGSGKSYVCNVFKKLGVPVYNSDDSARKISNNSEIVKSQIISLLGKKAYKNKLLNRQFIASIVFNNKELLDRLNSIIHPVVEKDFNDWCSSKQEFTYVLKEAAILFETGIYKKLDSTIAIIASESIRLQRVLERENINEEAVRKRMKNQWSAEKITSLADFIIENNSKKLLLPQILNIHKKLRL